MKDVRKKIKDEQKKVIKKAFHEKTRIWHPDRNFGDDETARQITAAKEILLDHEKPARYNNETDYDKGWFSLERYRAIFWAAYWRRIGMTSVSCGVAVGRIVLTALRIRLTALLIFLYFCGTLGSFLAATAASSALVVCGAVSAGVLSGARMLSVLYVTTKDSVVNGPDTKKCLAKAVFGILGVTLTGGAVAGIIAGVASIGSTALESSAVTLRQYVENGAGSGAVGGVILSLTSNAARKFVDELTWKKFLGHAAAGAVVGAAIGFLGGLVTKGNVNPGTEAVIVTAAEFIKLINWKKAKGLLHSTQDKTRELHEHADLHEASKEEPAEQPEATFKYKSEGAWFSKMVVKYSLNSEPIEKEVNGSGKIIRIPLTATHVEVKFQVPLWGYIMKYDRFEEKWCKPYKPHVFRYEKPPLQRTFTISGNLGWGAVTRVSDEYDEETREMDAYIQQTNVKTAGK